MSEAAWDAVFQEDGGEESKLAKGIQAKIIAAAQATEEGDTLLIPSRGAHASAGKQWRIVVELAAARDLTPTELQLFDIWLEERWGTEVAETFAKPLRNVRHHQMDLITCRTRRVWWRSARVYYAASPFLRA